LYVRVYVCATYIHVHGTYHLQCAYTSNGTEDSITLSIYTSDNILIALGWRPEMIMGFHEYTYQDHEKLNQGYE